MTRTVRVTSGRLIVLLIMLTLLPVRNMSQARAQGGFRSSRAVPGVYKDRIVPHWLADNVRFWYRNDLSGKTKEFILVNAERGTRTPAFDHARLAAALSQTTSKEYQADQLPFDTVEFAEGGKVVRFTVDGATWACDLASYACTKTDLGPIQSPAGETEGSSRFGRRGSGSGRDRGPSADSPDGKWTAGVKEHNVFVKNKDGDAEVQFSTDGTEGNAYGMLSWAPDSKTLVAWRIEAGDGKEVFLIESSPKEGGRAKFIQRSYSLPGDKFKMYELSLFDVGTRKHVKPAVDRLELDWQTPRLHWKTDGRHFAYEKVDRGHQRFRVIEVDSHTGESRNLIDEKSETFIWTAHTENLSLRLVNWLDRTDEILYVSERDGWRHLYLIDAA
jgi:hypothetical protein